MRNLVGRRSYIVYTSLASGLAALAGSVALATVGWNSQKYGPVVYPLAALAWLLGCFALLHFFQLRRPVTLTPVSVSLASLWGEVDFPVARVVEARWSVRFRSPTLHLRSAQASGKVRFPDFSNPDQLLLIRYIRRHLPARCHRDWHRFCRYASFVRRQTMLESRDTRSPSQRRWDAIFKWIGTMTEAVLISMFSKEAGQAHIQHEMSEELARNAIPHEAISATDWDERLFELGAWFTAITAIVLLAAIYWVPGSWRIYFVGGAIALVIFSIVSWRKQGTIEEEVAMETASQHQTRWDNGENR